jgi:hypothetical protein
MKAKILQPIGALCLVTVIWGVILVKAQNNVPSDTNQTRVGDHTITGFFQQAELVSSNGEAYDWLGVSVAFNGGIAAVGAHGDDVDGNFNQGAVYVFQLADSVWIQRAMLTASDGSESSYLGQEVIMNENFIVASAANEVYVYDSPAGGWITTTETVEIHPPDDQTGDFGLSMSIQGNVLVIGAPYSTVNGNSAQGAVYVYEYQVGEWVLSAKLTASDGQKEDRFGYVDIDGDTIVVGAGGKDIGGKQNQGKAYIFVEPPTGWITATETAMITASDGEAEDYFGFATSIYSKTIVIGSADDDIGSNFDQGSAYIFTEPTDGWVTTTETAKLIASDGAELDYFGLSVEAGDGIVMIGAPDDEINQNSDQGSVYVFVGNGPSWTEQEKITASDGTGDNHDYFGQSISYDGNALLIGAFWSDIGDNLNQGAAYVFTDTIFSTPTPTITLTPTATNTPSPSATHTPTPTPTPTATNTPTFTDSPSPTIKPTSASLFLYCPIVIK